MLKKATVSPKIQAGSTKAVQRQLIGSRNSWTPASREGKEGNGGGHEPKINFTRHVQNESVAPYRNLQGGGK